MASHLGPYHWLKSFFLPTLAPSPQDRPASKGESVAVGGFAISCEANRRRRDCWIKEISGSPRPTKILVGQDAKLTRLSSGHDPESEIWASSLQTVEVITHTVSIITSQVLGWSTGTRKLQFSFLPFLFFFSPFSPFTFFLFSPLFLIASTSDPIPATSFPSLLFPPPPV